MEEANEESKKEQEGYFINYILSIHTLAYFSWPCAFPRGKPFNENEKRSFEPKTSSVSLSLPLVPNLTKGVVIFADAS